MVTKTMNKDFAQFEQLRAVVFVDSASEALQNMACTETMPEELKLTLRGVDSVLDGVRELLVEIGRRIEAEMPADTMEEG